MELSTLLILLAFCLSTASPSLYISSDGFPVCSLEIFSVEPFDFEFRASCEKWFASVKDLFTYQLNYKNISTFYSLLLMLFND